MHHAPPVGSMTFAEYLVFEEGSDVRHEYLDGRVYAMAGGSLRHSSLAAEVGRLLSNGVTRRPCWVFQSDARLRVTATGLTTYPDVSVACGEVERDEDDPEALINPVVIVEVLSSSTEAYDRGPKAAHYRRIPSLKEYVLVSTDEERIEVQRRTAEGRWELVEAVAGEKLELSAVPVVLDLSAIYARAPASAAEG